MKFGDFPLDQCNGAILAHSIAGIAKGTCLSEGDLNAARDAGITSLPVAIAEMGDLSENEGAAKLADALASPSVIADAARHGRVNLRAAHDGLVILDAEAVAAVNAVSEAVTLGTLRPHARVGRGDIVATVKVIPFFVADICVERAVAAAPPLTVAAFVPRDVVLLQTYLPGTSGKMLAKTAKVTEKRIAALGGRFYEAERPPHETEALADALATIDADMILIAGAAATSDRRDVVPAALEKAGGHVERLGMPVDPGNLLLLGSLDGRPVIGLPGCARSPKYNGFDMVLERLFAEIAVSSIDIAAMGVGGVLAEVDRPDPRELAQSRRVSTVGALILAAGRSTRMGANKLTAPLGEDTVIGRTVAAARAAALPHLVVTGHEAEKTRAALPETTPFVHAENYAAGMGESLSAGIRALPPAWDAVIVMLGDMPLVEPELLRELAETAIDVGDIVTPVRNGRCGNPVLWGRDHFAALAAIEGDFGGKAVLAERQDHIIDVEAPSEAIFLDCDTPDALERVRRLSE